MINKSIVVKYTGQSIHEKALISGAAPNLQFALCPAGVSVMLNDVCDPLARTLEKKQAALFISQCCWWLFGALWVRGCSSPAVTMSSVQAFRDFINERLKAAAGEIFAVFEQTVVQYEEEIDRHRRLLELCWKPQIKLHRTELPQHHDCTEEQLFHQETNDCREQEEPEPPLIQEQEQPGLLQFKEEPETPQNEQHEEFSPIQEGEQLILKFEGDAFIVPSTDKQSGLSEPEVVPDTEQFLSDDCESTTNAHLKKLCTFHGDSVENFPVAEQQAEDEKILCEETWSKTVCKKRDLCLNLGTVTDKKRLICELCGKSYSRQDFLTSHMRAHTGEKLYSCETCGKGFNKRNKFMSHKRTHTGEKPHTCESCGKSFSQKNNLSSHMRTHTGEKPFPCEICGKSFSRKSNLLVHVRRHTGEKRDSCKTREQFPACISVVDTHENSHR
ncbi:zinc finger protein 182-like [Salarias fasciatus]|uniref:zinc finger protein 182-like n=1 Tax=Salarias fasciatus TaxID=181472 RepID=UPI001176528C|nr:zinc finger protein 182-like [Salarias fasciatus]